MTSAHYTRTAVALHWLIAALIIAAVCLGWIMTDLSISPTKLKLYNYHKWVGVTVLGLAMTRLIWRLSHQPPALITRRRWQQFAARGGHALLYVLMLAMPLSGWIYSNAAGFPVVYLGKLPLPNLVERNLELAAQWVQVHETLGIALVAVAAVHILAALKHHFFDRDDTLRRIMRWRKA